MAGATSRARRQLEAGNTKKTLLCARRCFVQVSIFAGGQKTHSLLSSVAESSGVQAAGTGDTGGLKVSARQLQLYTGTIVLRGWAALELEEHDLATAEGMQVGAMRINTDIRGAYGLRVVGER